ncbi:MAG: cyclic nucleotide-binding domain-containing protein [Spirochaetes bacterium]|nr:cyclic nucleotide-binding domain-containing protein [Spirochaetota bacterium]
MRKIYEVMDIADAAYILHEGKITFEISAEDKYYLEGKEIVFGAEEPLIAYKSERDEYFRFQSVYVDDESKVDKIPPQNLYKVLSNYNIAYTVTKNIARFLGITNRIYINKEKKLSGTDMASKEYARLYVEVIDELKQMYEKVRTGWLKEVIDRYTNSLVYTKGLAFRRGASKQGLMMSMEQLSDYTFNLRAGSILCEENAEGNEMFILNRGNLEVLIGGKKVADIHDAGTVIGEMALLLGERRTATIKTVTDCNITIIKPENLKEAAQNSQDFFLNIAVNLGKRLENNCNLIRETEELLAENRQSTVPIPPKERPNYKALLTLIRDLERYDIKYKNEWMSKLVVQTKKRVNDARELWK